MSLPLNQPGRWTARYLLPLALGGLWPLSIGLSAEQEYQASAGNGQAASGLGEAATRRPVALVLTDGGRWLFAANRRSGTVSVIDAAALEVRAELALGKSLSDLAEGPRERLLALEDRSHELLLLEREGPDLRVVQRLSVSPYPARLAVTQDGRRCFVASPWSGRLDVIELGGGGPNRQVSSLELPFPPREMLPIAGGSRLIAGDAFGGRLAIIDVERGQVERVIEIPGHNIRGLAVEGGGAPAPEEKLVGSPGALRGAFSPSGGREERVPERERAGVGSPGALREAGRLLVTHQRVERNARTDREDLVWGVFITNALLSMDLHAVLTAGEDALHGSREIDLGHQVIPSGDPERVLVTDAGEVVVGLAGVGRVAIGRTSWPLLDHVRVGRRPTALAAAPDGRLFVANTHSDSISVIDIAGRRPLGEISLGPQAVLGAADRGELLFYDAGLSLRGWMSCHSCHTEGHTSGIVADTQGDGSYGAPKRVPSLFGVAESGPWGWNGQINTLFAQIEKSLRTTLHASQLSADQVSALEGYLGKLEPPALPAEKEIEGEASLRGEAIFRQKCSRCHMPPAYTSASTYDVGLADEVGNRRFNPPSLRGVRHRTSFFHDGRARELHEVFTRHRHPAAELAEDEVRDLISFLKSL